MAISLAHSSGVVLVKGLNTSQPALLTSTSMGPSCSVAALTAASTCARSVMSQAKAAALPPGAVMPSATFGAAARSRSNTATWAPAWAKRRQVAPPMPPPPPVTITVWFLKSLMVCLLKKG